MIARRELLKIMSLSPLAVLPTIEAPRFLLLQYDEPDISLALFNHAMIDKVRSSAPLTREDRETIAADLDSHLTCWDVAPKASEVHGPERKRLLRQAWLEQLKHMNAHGEACAEGRRERAAFHDGASCGLSYAQKLLTSGGDSIHLDRPWHRQY